MHLNDIVKESYDIAVKHGWWDNGRPFPQTVMMIITELSEAVQEDRKGNRKKMYEELADTFIRLCDLCGSLGIDIESEISKKMEYNKKRPYKHDRKY